jgi:hypothetical protein
MVFMTYDIGGGLNSKNAPPSQILFPDPPGPIAYAAVLHAGREVGFVWMTVSLTARPRAGLVLSTEGEPDDDFQSELGTVALNVGDVDAWEWLDFLAASYTGLHDGLQVVADVRSARRLSEVYRAAGHATIR